VKEDAERVVTFLVSTGIADDQNWPYLETIGKTSLVTFENGNNLSVALKQLAYPELYSLMVELRLYTALLADGALFQVSYEFYGADLMRHRLGFWPSPFLQRFQDDPELYMEDVFYADVLSRAIVPFPVRFDFDARPGVYEPVRHPMSHLTLGQYERCRIPVSAALAPVQFAHFILRNFYNSAMVSLTDEFPPPSGCFADCIHAEEAKLAHFVVPKR
jgi:hypothetical protein